MRIAGVLGRAIGCSCGGVRAARGRRDRALAAAFATSIIAFIVAVLTVPGIWDWLWQWSGSSCAAGASDWGPGSRAQQEASFEREGPVLFLSRVPRTAPAAPSVLSCRRVWGGGAAIRSHAGISRGVFAQGVKGVLERAKGVLAELRIGVDEQVEGQSVH